MESLEEMPYTEAAMTDGIRLVQQSLTLRKVLVPCKIDDKYDLVPGQLLSTLLSVTNCSSEFLPNPTQFDPARYDKTGITSLAGDDRRFAVSAFGHGLRTFLYFSFVCMRAYD